MPLFDGVPWNAFVNGKAFIEDTSADDVIAAPGSGRRIAVLGVVVSNADDVVATVVRIRSGTTDKLVGYNAAEGGFSLSGGGNPLFVGGDNEAITAICDTTASQTHVFVQGVYLPT